jgi:para-aminobenzoate synthetase/4-amino-4-deoxychorismate lyase
VPIRTLLIGAGSGEMGVGGGIVWDSTPAGELTECQLKAKFLLDAVG